MNSTQLPLGLSGVAWRPPTAPVAQPSPADRRTVAEAREEFREAIRAEELAECPCCARRARARKRKLSSTMARYLAAMAAAQIESRGAPVDVTKLPIYQSGTQRGDYAYMRHWGLIERLPEILDNQDGGPSGVWRVTEMGYAFVWGRVLVPSHAWILDNELVRDMGADGFTEQLVSFTEALGARFDYDEVVHGRPGGDA